MMGLPLLGLAHLLSMPTEFEYAIQVFDYTLEITRIDLLSRVFGIVVPTTISPGSWLAWCWPPEARFLARNDFSTGC